MRQFSRFGRLVTRYVFLPVTSHYKWGGGRLRKHVCPSTPDQRTTQHMGQLTLTSPYLKHFLCCVRLMTKYVLSPVTRLPVVVRSRLGTLAFLNRTPHFNPKHHGHNYKGKQICHISGAQIGSAIHRRVPRSTGRRGRRMSLRSNCVIYYLLHQDNVHQPYWEVDVIIISVKI